MTLAAPALTTVVFVGLLITAAWSDLRTRRIPNVLTVSGLGVAIALRSFGGGDAVLDGVLGAALALLVALAMLALGGFGGGDAKLLIAVGAFTGPKLFGVAFALTAMAGAGLALLEAGFRGDLRSLFRSTGSLALNFATLGKKGRRQTLGDARAVRIPYGVAIAVGSLAGWFLV